MSIIEIHNTGGPLFMWVLSILFIAVITSAVFSVLKRNEIDAHQKWLKISQEIALFALVWGLFGQLLGLFGAFQGIEMMGEVSQAMLAGGLKVSSFTSIYGFLIFLLAKLFKIVMSISKA